MSRRTFWRTLALVAAIGVVLARPENQCRNDIAPTPHQHPAEVNHEANIVFRRDSRGWEQWATVLDGRVGGSRWPCVVEDAERVYVAHEDGLTALKASTGRVLWHSPGPKGCLYLSDDLLLATDGEVVTARATRDGGEVFRVPSPPGEFHCPVFRAPGAFSCAPAREERGLVSGLPHNPRPARAGSGQADARPGLSPLLWGGLRFRRQDMEACPSQPGGVFRRGLAGTGGREPAGGPIRLVEKQRRAGHTARPDPGEYRVGVPLPRTPFGGPRFTLPARQGVDHGEGWPDQRHERRFVRRIH
jgi:hypothetical protein